ncbi:MAG TPA: ImmA/IrrE family metallo-endopeptidase [Gordonia sp. (in: high G+C Gram-positive bacteria)]|uniref:ImmA/IrrE family metallo-endopeptidase n=1 Tax=Gordonia sp. (in: high G+C Gram-positive bacteria) TaxID=84139 RepID=UPI002CEE5F51|nr:ImmA/IrrE family metallo-endopeptidase [Gordonia sp. (in: high G+C Gram-positive bacteria)]HQV16721.1 ImmA/IrrE family metallo-endopeptidase [Gordonia sp. (in: high G+C Gram-positive bacteria)]
MAAAVGMTPDALSRAIHGQRGFGAAELMRIADHFDADLHTLISGEPDPRRPRLVARHDYDQSTRTRSIPGHSADRPILDDITLAYRQALLAPREGWSAPSDVEAARTQLGAGFVRPFVERIEERLGIEVVRVGELSTAYSFIVDGRPVIAIPATASWFRENWSIAHELGHLVLGHHANPETRDADERAAHGFAAELLLPAADMRSLDWQGVTPADLAAWIWDLGVSTEALANRLESLGIESPVVRDWSGYTTQRLLRHHWVPSEADDPITIRMDAAAVRRFPVALQTAHLDRIARGEVGKGILAWMLGVADDSLEVEEPTPRPGVSTSDLLDALGI